MTELQKKTTQEYIETLITEATNLSIAIYYNGMATGNFDPVSENTDIYLFGNFTYANITDTFKYHIQKRINENKLLEAHTWYTANL